MEPVKLTAEEGKALNLLVSSIEALDEHVALQVKARGELVQQKKDWWNKILKKYNLVKSNFYFNSVDGSVHKNAAQAAHKKV